MDRYKLNEGTLSSVYDTPGKDNKNNRKNAVKPNTRPMQILSVCSLPRFYTQPEEVTGQRRIYKWYIHQTAQHCSCNGEIDAKTNRRKKEKKKKGKKATGFQLDHLVISSHTFCHLFARDWSKYTLRLGCVHGELGAIAASWGTFWVVEKEADGVGQDGERPAVAAAAAAGGEEEEEERRGGGGRVGDPAAGGEQGGVW